MIADNIDEAVLKVGCWNVNSVKARLPLVCAFLQQEKPDILLLQETKTTDKTFPVGAFSEYNCYFHGQASYNGVAILVAKSLVVETWEIVPLLEDHARCMRVKIDQTWIYSVYVPCGEGPTTALQNKTRFMQNLVNHLAENPNQKTIIAGDFNVAMTDKDVEFPIKFNDTPICLPQFRKLMTDIFDKGELIDAYSPTEGYKNDFTWWHYFGYKFYVQLSSSSSVLQYSESALYSGGLRIDYILYSKTLLRAVSNEPNLKIFKEYRNMTIKAYSDKVETITKPSDHVPLVITLPRQALR